MSYPGAKACFGENVNRVGDPMSDPAVVSPGEVA